MRTKIDMLPVRRRQLLKIGGACGVAAIAGNLLPGLARADARAVNAAIEKLIGDRTPGTGRIALEMPLIAEDGNMVPIAIEVESPMTETDYVKAVHLFADRNPRPKVATLRFTPASGRAKASTRMRLAETQNIIAVAEMSDGSTFMAKARIRVTIGGCGS
ncbi:MAG: thiosulfate oxidation carrier protein SoxY [Alphaproteobacteria bacterium]|jgi:sulfur-oxidizing protein SoxY|nr:thiosulfate oxidation carrier protein SoxY [Alphaproteobacteria bacterium]MDP6814761.1 thiosulfate oxidation carrier protein SoxY [Alphaproteobacteria bacterium]